MEMVDRIAFYYRLNYLELWNTWRDIWLWQFPPQKNVCKPGNLGKMKLVIAQLSECKMVWLKQHHLRHLSIEITQQANYFIMSNAEKCHKDAGNRKLTFEFEQLPLKTLPPRMPLCRLFGQFVLQVKTFQNTSIFSQVCSGGPGAFRPVRYKNKHAVPEIKHVPRLAEQQHWIL